VQKLILTPKKLFSHITDGLTFDALIFSPLCTFGSCRGNFIYIHGHASFTFSSWFFFLVWLQVFLNVTIQKLKKQKIKLKKLWHIRTLQKILTSTNNSRISDLVSCKQQQQQQWKPYPTKWGRLHGLNYAIMFYHKPYWCGVLTGGRDLTWRQLMGRSIVDKSAAWFLLFTLCFLREC